MPTKEHQKQLETEREKNIAEMIIMIQVHAILRREL